jgi:hypothetical protein
VGIVQVLRQFNCCHLFYFPFFALGTFFRLGFAFFAAGEAFLVALASIAPAASFETPSFFAIEDAALSNPGCFDLLIMHYLPFFDVSVFLTA